MQTRGRNKRNNRLEKTVTLWDTIFPWSANRRLRCELACTEALLAEAQRKLSAGGRAQADRHKQKIWAKAAEIRGDFAALKGRGR